MRKFKKMIAISILFLLVLVSALQVPQNVEAKTYYNSYSKVSNEQKNLIQSLIAKQNFSQISNQAACNYADYFLYKSAWKVGRKFPYSNNRKYANTISDGTYKYNVGKTKGCYAYAKFVQKVFYGGKNETGTRKYSDSKSVTADGIHNLLKTNGQAGEHLRIDNKHSLVFLGATDSGFYALSYENGPIRLVYFTWSNFAAKYKGYRVWLYNVETATNQESAKNQTSATNNTDNKVVVDQSVPVISNVTTPGTIKKGSSWTCTGTITSASNLISVCGQIVNANTNQIMFSYTDYVSAKSYNMAGSVIDRNLLFNCLDEGTYNYVVRATNAYGFITVISDPIQIVASGKPVISSASAPSTLKKGKSWTCTGVITSDKALKSVTGQILDERGNVVYTYTKNTTAKTYRMAGSIIDCRLYFNKLDRGTYYYRIIATNQSGTTVWTSTPIVIL